MRQDKKKIYNHLLEYQKRYGGYTGKDLDETARIFGLNRGSSNTAAFWGHTNPVYKISTSIIAWHRREN